MFVLQMASLLLGQYSTMVGGYLIIDCRYPYEYLGGHVMVMIPIILVLSEQSDMVWHRTPSQTAMLERNGMNSKVKWRFQQVVIFIAC